MKRVYIILIINLFYVIIFHAQTSAAPSVPVNDTASYPYWITMMQDPSVNFFQVQRAFNLYWENRPITKSCGWKVYKRWEYMMMNRINPDGSRPADDATFKAYSEMQRSVRSSAGNWVSQGPAEIPAPGPEGYEGLGRLNAIGFHPTDPMKIFAAAPSGGLWHSDDMGETWASNTDTLPTLGVSTIVVDYSNTSTIFIGTGDRDAGDAPGMGVFKSSDGGLTWTTWNSGMGNKTVGRLIQHPTNPLIMIAATSGGIYRTTNGGSTWTQTRSGDFKDIVFKPGDPSLVYAAAGPDFYRSTDNGLTFTQITSGLSGGQRGAIAVTPANPEYVYFLVSGNDSGFKGFYRSANSGISFQTRSASPNILDWSCDGSGGGGQGWYDLAVAASPANAEEVFAGGVNVWRSTDGGQTWLINSHWYGGCGVPAVHADCHFLGYSPADGKLYAGNDGGIYSTNNSGITWTGLTEGMTIGQIYKLGQSQTNRDKVINGFQDNGTYTHLSTGWVATGGGDGMECAIDPTDAAYTYHTIYYGDIYRRKNNQGETHVAGNGVYGITESGAWVTPFIIHEQNPNTMFAGYKNVWRSTNIKTNNITWKKISSGLAGSNSNNIAALEQSPADTNILYLSRYDNKLFRSDNCCEATPTWTNLTSNLPTSGLVTDVEASPADPNTVYVCIGNNIYKSNDKGLNWTVISGNLTGIHLNTIACDKNSDEGIYVGTDAGVYYRDASMSVWIPFSNGLPANGRVTELEIYSDAVTRTKDLISASTYGRGMWQSDLYNVGPVVDFTADKTILPTGCTVDFTDISTDSPFQWMWTFEGGTPSSSTEQNPSGIQYNTAGVYMVKLNACNTEGCDSLVKTGFITVSDNLFPEVIFNADKRILCENEIVHFYDNSVNCPNGWLWEFQPSTVTFINGTSPSSRNPVVQFNETGSYDLKLTVTNGVGQTIVTEEDYILYGGYLTPFSEGFEQGFNYREWKIVNPDGAMTWDTIILSEVAGGNAAWINFYGYFTPNRRDQLISPPLNFSGSTSLTLGFDHAYAQRSTIKDSLIVKISSDCGATWTRVLEAGPDDSDPNVFATHSKTGGAFYPYSSEDWCGSGYGTPCYSIDISDWIGLPNVKLMFESYNRNGNNLFIDNILIDGIIGENDNTARQSMISIFPNPSCGEFTLLMNDVTGTAAISAFDLNGRVLYSAVVSPDQGKIRKQLSLAGFPRGLYYLRVTTEASTRVEKFVIR